MEPDQRQTSRARPEQEDMDLGHLLYKVGRAIKNLLAALGRGIHQLGIAILMFLFFLRKNILWLLLGLLLGMGYGFYLKRVSGAAYTSEMTVRANFNSARALYGSIDMLNALISNDLRQDLSTIFSISPAEAASLQYFEVNPIKSEVYAAEIYHDRFLRANQAQQTRTDTFWMNTIRYKDFKRSLTSYDYPVHEITCTSTNPALFTKLQRGILQLVAKNDLLQNVKSSNLATLKHEIELLTHSIRGLDSLRSAYNSRIANPGSGERGSNVMLLERLPDAGNPELLLYDKLLALNERLTLAREKAVTENEILQVYSPFSLAGKEVPFMKRKVVVYGLTGLLLAFLILVAIGLYTYLKKLENRYQKP